MVLPKKEEIWDEPDNPHSIICSKCGANFPPSYSNCPNCGTEYDWGSGKREYADLAGFITITGSQAQTFSGTISTTITNLEKIPFQQRKELGLESLLNDLPSLKAQVDSYEVRFQTIEDEVRGKIAKYDELKEKLELKIPEEVYRSLPPEIKSNIELIRKLYFQGIPEACAPFIRKALTTAIVIRFKIDGEEDKTHDEKGQPYDLPKLIEISKQKGNISNSLSKDLLRIKLFGDIGIHDYRIDLTKEDVIPLFELLRLTLESLYKKKGN